jgi:hypothetical protein
MNIYNNIPRAVNDYYVFPKKYSSNPIQNLFVLNNDYDNDFNSLTISTLNPGS